MPTTAERLAAYVAAEKQKKRDVEEAAERVKEVRRAKEAALLAEREEQAAAAADERLRLATYKMPPDEPQQQPNSPSSQQHPQQQHPQQQHPQQQQHQHGALHRPTTAKRSQKAAAERHVARRKPAGKDAPSLPPTSRTGGGPASAATAADLLYGPTSEASRAPLDDEAAGPPIQADLALFVHFLPPPLRDPAKPHLSWIVHTCDGSGCHAAKHVSFFSISGFSTYEGAPPERESGLACGCTIANHHLRGYGRVRWEGEHAIVEDAEADQRVAMVNARAYLAKANKAQGELSKARDRIKAMKAVEEDLRAQLRAARTAAAAKGGGGAALSAGRVSSVVASGEAAVPPPSAAPGEDGANVAGGADARGGMAVSPRLVAAGEEAFQDAELSA